MIKDVAVAFALGVQSVLTKRSLDRLGVRLSYTGEHFERWVEFLAGFSREDRERLANLYGAPSSDARALGSYMCDQQEYVCEVVARAVGPSETLELLQEIALEHDFDVPVLPSPIESRRTLVKLGILKDARASHAHMPGVWGVLLGPLLTGIRTSLLTLLGMRSTDELMLMAKTWDVVPKNRVDAILKLAECLSGPDALNEIAARLPDLDYLGASLVAIELGGVCFWQEVFGYELEEASADAKVVPFMRRDERAMERDIAETLTSLGVVFRIEDDDVVVLVVPEELRHPIWELGRSWLLDWMADTFEAANLTAHRKEEPRRHDLQAAMKWLSLEASAGSLGWHVDGLDESTLERLARVAGHDARYWEDKVEFGVQLGAFFVEGDHLRPARAFETTLDLAKPAFVRHVLLEWCTGFVGSKVDVFLPRATGLDDAWRKQMLKVLTRADEFIPLWMKSEGVEPLMTGAGCLRDLDDSSEETLVTELALANAVMWTTKLVWLDLVSMLGADYWYSLKALADLAQIVGAFAMFSHVSQVLEQPELGLYLPVQRASFMTDAFHANAFEMWVSDVIEHLLEPLGVAYRHPESGSIWLDTALLRIPSPPGLTDVYRATLMQEIFNDPSLQFPVAGPNTLRLHRAESNGDPRTTGLDLPIAELREWLAGREVTQFDGQRLRVD